MIIKRRIAAILAALATAKANTPATTVPATVSTPVEKVPFIEDQGPIRAVGIVDDVCDQVHDKNNDGRVDAFDLVIAKQNNEADQVLIYDFVLGKETSGGTRVMKYLDQLLFTEENYEAITFAAEYSDAVRLSSSEGNSYLRIEAGSYAEGNHTEVDVVFEPVMSYSELQEYGDVYYLKTMSITNSTLVASLYGSPELGFKILIERPVYVSGS